MASRKFAVSSLVDYVQDFPVVARVVDGGGSTIAGGSKLVLLFVESHRAVTFRDSRERLFSEVTSFGGCHFQRLPENPGQDDKMFITAANVLEKPANTRPTKVMASVGYVSETTEILKHDVFAVMENCHCVNGEQCVQWSRIDQQGKVTDSVCVPLSAKAMFITRTDPNRYSLAQVTDCIKQCTWRLPLRLQTCAQSEEEDAIKSVKTGQKLTAVTLTKKQYVVAVFGEELVRLPHDANLLLEWVESDTRTVSSALSVLSKYTNTSKASIVSSPVEGSLSWQENYKPDLPPRRRSSTSSHQSMSSLNEDAAQAENSCSSGQEDGYEEMETAVKAAKRFLVQPVPPKKNSPSPTHGVKPKPRAAPRPVQVRRWQSSESIAHTQNDGSDIRESGRSVKNKRRLTMESPALPHNGPQLLSPTDQQGRTNFPRYTPGMPDTDSSSVELDMSPDVNDRSKSPYEGYIKFKSRKSDSQLSTYEMVNVQNGSFSQDDPPRAVQPKLRSFGKGSVQIGAGSLQLENAALKQERDLLKKKLTEMEIECAELRKKVDDVKRLLVS